ncbi:solute carrier family 66 [Acrasis kona]|uniref:Solute carrier family 66 n=1 Tax=Acrasis kona TaxID=1008807 RepID=A0AAW2YN67_9EUKA
MDVHTHTGLGLQGLVIRFTNNHNQTCIDWPLTYFGECINNQRGMAGLGLGIASISIFLISVLPQIYQNFRRRDAGALSGIMISIWILAGTGEVLGSVLMKEFGIQLYVSCCYLLIDVLLLIQFLYFQFKSKIKERSLRQMTVTINESSGRSRTSSGPKHHNRLLPKPKDSTPPKGAPFHMVPKRSTLIQSHLERKTGSSPDDRKPNTKFGYEYYAKGTNESKAVDVHFPSNVSIATEDTEALSTYDTDTEVSRNVDERVFRNDTKRFKIVIALGLFGLFYMLRFTLLDFDLTSGQTNFRTGGRTLLSEDEDYKDLEEPVWEVKGAQAISGYCIGCVAAMLFLISRIFQIVKNWRRKSTEGLSCAMFFLSCLANIIFIVSVFLISSHQSYILAHLPWLIGSVATISFDVYILLQCWIYHKQHYVNLDA